MAIIPLGIYWNAAKQYDSNARLRENIMYEFYDNTLKVTGNSFSGERELSKTYKILELNRWFLIYENRAVANIIPKKDMSAEEVDALRTFLRDVQGNCKKKLKAV